MAGSVMFGPQVSWHGSSSVFYWVLEFMLREATSADARARLQVIHDDNLRVVLLSDFNPTDQRELRRLLSERLLPYSESAVQRDLVGRDAFMDAVRSVAALAEVDRDVGIGPAGQTLDSVYYGGMSATVDEAFRRGLHMAGSSVWLRMVSGRVWQVAWNGTRVEVTAASARVPERAHPVTGAPLTDWRPFLGVEFADLQLLGDTDVGEPGTSATAVSFEMADQNEFVVTPQRRERHGPTPPPANLLVFFDLPKAYKYMSPSG